SSSSTTAPRRARTYLTPSEALLVEALTARILPGSSEDPGAREGEVVVYIDGLLASGGGYGEPVYRSGPFVTPGEVDPTAEEDAEEDSGDESGDAASASDGVVARPVGTFGRYGEQSIL